MTGAAMLCHDPRISNVRCDKRETTNDALILADIMMRAGEPVEWEEVAEAADNCDWPVDQNGALIIARWP
jgi:hypothetical protein